MTAASGHPNTTGNTTDRALHDVRNRDGRLTLPLPGKRRQGSALSTSGHEGGAHEASRLLARGERLTQRPGPCLEFAGHYGFTFAHDLHRRGYQVVNV